MSLFAAWKNQTFIFFAACLMACSGCSDVKFASSEMGEKRAQEFMNENGLANQVIETSILPSTLPAEPLPAEDKAPETALEPILVGGAFLSCQVDFKGSTNSILSTACDFSPLATDEARAKEIRFKFSNGKDRPRASAINAVTERFESDPVAKKWTWFFAFNRADLKPTHIFISIGDDARPGEIPLAFDLEISKNIAQTFSILALHFGDQAFRATLGSVQCSYNQDQVSSVGIRKDWSFEVESTEAVVVIDLTGVCGIGGGGNRKSFVSVIDQAQQLRASIALDQAVAAPSLGPIVLTKGTFRLQVSSYRYTNGDYDDFLIGSIRATASQGALRILTP